MGIETQKPRYAFEEWHNFINLSGYEAWLTVGAILGVKALPCPGCIGIPQERGGTTPGCIDVEGLNGCSCGAGAGISLPTWRFPIERVMELMWRGGLQLIVDKAVQMC
ncbi:hypothetical protein SLEP1_g35653 [Rubroshorea leprosula]|uniref:Uncharacterized protein n=1 Tax=Rubroshorea leprosula TaxID=152421 RepID=A0AAV5KP25_9ROSI|nr:hypothetical protein SLEP1_g35653 [Rubroshorea leprosula]